GAYIIDRSPVPAEGAGHYPGRGQDDLQQRRGGKGPGGGSAAVQSAPRGAGSGAAALRGAGAGGGGGGSGGGRARHLSHQHDPYGGGDGSLLRGGGNLPQRGRKRPQREPPFGEKAGDCVPAPGRRATNRGGGGGRGGGRCGQCECYGCGGGYGHFRGRAADCWGGGSDPGLGARQGGQPHTRKRAGHALPLTLPLKWV
ncbi:hypothetical protein B484DRAFT_217131, partial [Ochromonadaceae sp. CCMP2298]